MPPKRSPKSPRSPKSNKKYKQSEFKQPEFKPPQFKSHLDFNSFINFNNNKYYPKKSSINFANKWNNGNIPKPIEILNENYNLNKIKLNKDENFLIHLFKNDLRINDNTSLQKMFSDSILINAKPIGLYIISTKFWNSHQESAYKIKFTIDCLKELRKSLEKLNIPLSIIFYDENTDTNSTNGGDNFTSWLESLLISKFKTKSLYFNFNYEYDEFNRDINLILNNKNLNIKAFHDQCVISPMKLPTNKGTQYSVFSPWFKKWVSYLDENPISLQNDYNNNHIFTKWDWNSSLPNTTTTTESIDLYDELITNNEEISSNFKLNSLYEIGVTDSSISKTLNFYKPGEINANNLFNNWLNSQNNNNILSYQSRKDFPCERSTSRLSAYITQGCISTRYIVLKCLQLEEKLGNNGNNRNNRNGNNSIKTFIREIAWRDFYRHVVINWPFLMIFVPFNFSLNNLNWDNSNDYMNFKKWCLGETGIPIVDASMKQLLNEGYLNNRCRMIVSSFLSKDLSIDWRMGERWFYNHLIDGDFISNLNGWGFTSSTGINPQPWFRIFNVFIQSEKFDPNGKFIKKWLPQLSKIDSNLIHQPYNNKSSNLNDDEISKLTNNYPKPIIDREKARNDTLNRFREAL